MKIKNINNKSQRPADAEPCCWCDGVSEGVGFSCASSASKNTTLILCFIQDSFPITSPSLCDHNRSNIA